MCQVYTLMCGQYEFIHRSTLLAISKHISLTVRAVKQNLNKKKQKTKQKNNKTGVRVNKRRSFVMHIINLRSRFQEPYQKLEKHST